MAKACGATHIKIHGESNLIAQQFMKECDATYDNMITYRTMYNRLEDDFEGCKVTHIGQESNEDADTLANIGSKCLPIPPGVFFEEIFKRCVKIKLATIKPVLATRPGLEQAKGSAAATKHTKPVKTKPGKNTAQVMLVDPLWTKSYLAYMLHGETPEELIHHRQVIHRCKSFTVINGELYRRSTTGVLQRCNAPKDGVEIL
jgi:hypothetical protein